MEKIKLQHWCGVQGENDWNAAQVLEFVWSLLQFNDSLEREI